MRSRGRDDEGQAHAYAAGIAAAEGADQPPRPMPPHLTCSLGCSHEVCELCGRAIYRDGTSRQALFPPIGSRDSRYQVIVCSDCSDAVYDQLDTVPKLRRLIGLPEEIHFG